MLDRFDRLAAARARLRAAEKHRELALREGYPINSQIAWGFNGHVQRGSVVRHGINGGRIKVRNCRTGRELWIYDYRIVGGDDA